MLRPRTSSSVAASASRVVAPAASAASVASVASVISPRMGVALAVPAPQIARKGARKKGRRLNASVPNLRGSTRELLLPALALPRSGSVGRWRSRGHPLSPAPRAPVAVRNLSSIVLSLVARASGGRQDAMCDDAEGAVYWSRQNRPFWVGGA